MDATNGCTNEPSGSTTDSSGINDTINVKLNIFYTNCVSASNTVGSIPYYRITFGSFNRKDPRFLRDTAGKKDLTVGQNHSVVIVGWMYHFMYPPYEWGADHLDNILCRGTWLHFNFRCDYDDEYKQYNVDSRTFLEAINTGFFANFKKTYRFEPLTKMAFFGKFTGLRTKLKKYMDTCDETNRSILFICKQISFGIFGYVGLEGSIEYCLFDPHGRNSDGFFDYSEKSCVLCFKTVDNLVDLLARDGLFAHSLYECVPMQVDPITYKLRCFVTVTLHNTQKFVQGYLNGSDDWRDSSDSSDFYDEQPGMESDGDGDDDDELPLKSDMPVIGTITASGRSVKAPDRLEFESHPSFFRGKLREDKKRLEGKWKEWYGSKTAQERRNIKKKKKINWTVIAKMVKRRLLRQKKMREAKLL